MNQSLVIAVQRPNSSQRVPMDFTAASQYGRVEVLIPNGRQIMAPAKLRETVLSRLEELSFDPEHDYVIPIGDYSVLLFIGMILGARYDRINILRWVPEAKAYQPLPFDVA